MNKTVWLNIAFNLGLATVFVWLNMWALQSNLEETFVTLAMVYGLLVIGANALFVRYAIRRA